MTRYVPPIQFPMVHDENWLRHQYETLRKSIQCIADDAGCTLSTVQRAMKKHGITARSSGVHGSANWNWKGGRTHTNGYVRLLVDGKYIHEHRIVMAQHLGRPLTKTETVHHINGDRADNRIENLQLRVGRHGPGQAYRCMSCGSQDVKEEEIA